MQQPGRSAEHQQWAEESGIYQCAYHIDRQSSIFGGCQHQKLRATDYLYNGFQYGYNPTGMLASNQQALNYDVNRSSSPIAMASSDEWSSTAGAAPDHRSRTFWR